MDKAQLISEAQIIYEGIAPDLIASYEAVGEEVGLGDAASMVADRMYDEFGAAGCAYDYREIALEALKGYF
jgi:hypothetical protein